MRNVIGLEKNKVNFKLWGKVSLAILLGVLIFMFFFAGISYMKPQDVTENNVLGTYNFIYTMGLLIGIVTYTIESSMLFSATILDEYKNDGLYLLFTYPINRIGQFNAKLLVSFMMTVVYSIVGMTIAVTIFTLVSIIFAILPGQFMMIDYLSILKNIVMSGLIIGLLGMLSTLLALYKKSSLISISIALILSAIVCNLLSIVSVQIIPILVGIFAVTTFILYVIQRKNINTLEVF